MRIGGPAQAGISPIIEGAIPQTQMTDERPNLSIMPINDGMHAHKIRPATIGAIEVRQLGTVGIGAARPDKDGLHPGIDKQIVFKGGFDCCPGRVRRILHHVKMVGARGPLDEFLDVEEGVWGQGVDGRNGGQTAVFGGRVRVQTGEEEDEEDEAVFSAVVGEGEFGEGVAVEGGGDDVKGDAGLGLHGGEEGVWGVGFREETMDFVVAVGDDCG